MHRNQQTNVDMAHLEDLTRGTTVRGILPSRLVEVVDVQWHGTAAVTLVYKDGAGRVAHQLLFRDNEPALEIVTAGRLWRFDADGALLRLVSEAQRIRLAHLFDTLPGGPHLAGRSAAPPDHRRLWRDAPLPAAALSAGGRPRRQDHHGRATLRVPAVHARA